MARGSIVAIGFGLVSAISTCPISVLGADLKIIDKERDPLILLISSTGTTLSANQTDAMRQIAARTLAMRTRLFIETPGEAGVDAARLSPCLEHVRMGCLLDVLRPSDRAKEELPNGLLVPPSEQRSRVRASGDVNPPRYFLLITILPVRASVVELSAILLDLDLAVEERQKISDETASKADLLEGRLFQRATLIGGPTDMSVGDEPALIEYFGQLFDRAYQAAFRASNHWTPRGGLDIESPAAGLLITIDGESAGRTLRGVTRIASVPAGERQIALGDPDGGFEPFAARVTIIEGRTTTVAASPLSSPNVARTGAIVSGGAISVAGAIVTSYAVVISEQRLNGGFCTLPACTNGQGSTFAGSRGPGLYTSRSQGLLVGPLGASLLVSGAIISLGNLFFEGDRDPPWLFLVSGLLAGAAIYGVSAAVTSSR